MNCKYRTASAWSKRNKLCNCLHYSVFLFPTLFYIEQQLLRWANTSNQCPQTFNSLYSRAAGENRCWRTNKISISSKQKTFSELMQSIHRLVNAFTPTHSVNGNLYSIFGFLNYSWCEYRFWFVNCFQTPIDFEVAFLKWFRFCFDG